MRRFLLYVGDDYYPQRAVGDLVGDFDSDGECMAAACGHAGAWACVVEHASMVPVWVGKISESSMYENPPTSWTWKEVKK